MKLPVLITSMSNLEKSVAAVLALYIALPIDVPDMLCGIVDGPIGMVALFALTVYLFFHHNYLLAILFLFAGYEMLRRCEKNTGTAVLMKHTPSQEKKDMKMKKMNPPKKETLEEEVIDKMAPVGHSDPSIFTASGFSPVAEDVGSASIY